MKRIKKEKLWEFVEIFAEVVCNLGEYDWDAPYGDDDALPEPERGGCPVFVLKREKSAARASEAAEFAAM